MLGIGLWLLLMRQEKCWFQGTIGFLEAHRFMELSQLAYRLYDLQILSPDNLDGIRVIIRLSK